MTTKSKKSNEKNFVDPFVWNVPALTSFDKQIQWFNIFSQFAIKMIRFFSLFFHTYITAVPFIFIQQFFKITSQNLIIKLIMEQVGTEILSSRKITESPLYFFFFDLIYYYFKFNFGSVRNSEQLCVLKNWTINSKIRITIFMLHNNK